jgi:hypothetical protein
MQGKYLPSARTFARQHQLFFIAFIARNLNLLSARLILADASLSPVPKIALIQNLLQGETNAKRTCLQAGNVQSERQRITLTHPQYRL